MRLNDVIERASKKEISDAICQSYSEIVKHFLFRNWKTAGLDAGHFVEAVRRFLEIRLFGKTQPIGKSLPKFNETELSRYANAAGDESYRILIPRTLWSLYALRNKRSIGHLGAVPASEIDATLLLNGAKWVLSEIIRLESTLDADQTRSLVSSVIKRHEGIVWNEGDITRVLDISLDARQRALIILGFVGDRSEEQLRQEVQYKNPTNFRKILQRLDKANLICYSKDKVVISPTGLMEAERIAENSCIK
jgi:hypothetical protein